MRSALSGLTRALCSVSIAVASFSPAAAAAQDHPGQYDRADIEAGSRLYVAQCTQCHGPNGDLIATVDLRRGQFRTVVTDEDLARVVGTTGVPGKGMPAFRLQPNELTGIIAFIRAGFDVSGAAVKVGDAGRGRQLFDGKGACGSCHRVFGRGPRSAPDLTEIGAIRGAAALQRTLLDPTASMLPMNRPLRIVTRTGQTITGRRLNEDTYSVQILDAQDRLVSIEKADIRDYQAATASPMPSYQSRLTSEEISDLVAYLLSLKGVQP